MRHFAHASRSGWAFGWRAPRAADCSLSLERKMEKCGHFPPPRARRQPGTKWRVASRGLRRTRKPTHGTPAIIGGQGSAMCEPQIAGVYLKSHGGICCCC